MRPPEGADVARRWLIDGVHPRWHTRPLAFHVGHYAVSDVEVLDRNPREALKPTPGRPPDAEHYAFTIRGDGHTLRGDCQEHVLERVALGLGKTRVTLRCSCNEGDKSAVELKTEAKGGAIRFVDGTELPLAPAHGAGEGRSSKHLLGFVAEDPNGSGGVDLAGSNVAWVPASIAPHQRLGVACAYAALLLHHPWH